nr:MAG TPA_asm: hypothetical protein [Caudoviricetes sp.]
MKLIATIITYHYVNQVASSLFLAVKIVITLLNG